MTTTVQALVSKSTLAHLPAQALHIAAQFASTDPNKFAISNIYAQCVDGIISILSVDGHRAFRLQLNAVDSPWEVDGGIFIKPSTFRKRIPYAHFALFRDDGTVDILGGKLSKTSKTPPSELIESRPWRASSDHNFPNVNQLWPDKFSFQPGGSIAFNASYLSDFLDVVSRYSTNGVVTQSFNGAFNPLVYTSDCEIYGCTDAKLEFLLMPVQVRR